MFHEKRNEKKQLHIDRYMYNLINIYYGTASYMASCTTPVIHVWCFRCTICIEIQVYYMCSRYMNNTYVLHM